MPFGGGAHGIAPRIDNRRRSPGLERHQPHQRLQGDVKLGTKTAARRQRHDAHLLRRQAEHLRRVVAIHIGRLRAGLDDQHIAIHHRIARFRLDIGMLHIGRLDLARDCDKGFGKRAFRVAAFHEPAGQLIARPPLVQIRKAFPPRLIGRQRIGQFLPADRKGIHIECLDCIALARNQRHRLAAKPRPALGQRRLIGERRDDAKPVFAWDVGRRENRDNARMCRNERLRVTDLEIGMPVRRPHNRDRQRIGRSLIRAENLCSIDLALAIEPDRRGANRMTLLHHAGIDTHGAVGVHHRLDDLAIAGAATQNPAQRILNLSLRRCRVLLQKCCRAHQNTRCANPALGRPVA